MTPPPVSGEATLLLPTVVTPSHSKSLSSALTTLELEGRDWKAWFSGIFSVAIIGVIAWNLRDFGVVGALALLPSNPLFWFAFAAYYVALPFADWVIFRRLWHLPVGGFAALLRKLVSNELLFSYSGEVWFYAWARTHGRINTSPFGAIKDVSILSALAGNLMTLTMLVIAWPFIGALPAQFHGKAIFESGAAIVALSMLIFFLKSKLFSLPASQLKGIFAVHLARLIATTLLSGLMWHLAIPTLSLSWLVILAMCQLLVTRLPLVPNKDLVFAGLTVSLVGHAAPISGVIAMIATLLLATHLLAGAILILPDLIKGTKA